MSSGPSDSSVPTPREERSRDISLAIEGIEAASARSFYDAAPASVRRRLQIDYRELGGATLLSVAKSSHRYLNRVLCLGMAEEVDAGLLDTIEAYYRERRVRKIRIPLSPHARPWILGAMLEERGYRLGSGGTKMLLAIASEEEAPNGRTPPKGYRTEPVREGDESAWFAAMTQIFKHFSSRWEWFEARSSIPGRTDFAAYRGTEIAAVASLYVSGETAHLADAATLPQHRGIRLQQALIRARVRYGATRGVKLFTSETAPPMPGMPLGSYRNLLRCGFRLAYRRSTYTLSLNS